MTIASMTGFARVLGGAGVYRWAWELKSVNAKGLDARLRLPPAFDAIEPDARGAITRRLARGTIYATLSAQREAATPEVRINQDLLRKLIMAIADIPASGALAPATLDGLLVVRGVVEIADANEDESEILRARAGALADLDAALDALLATRQGEGEALAVVLQARLEQIAMLTQAARDCPPAADRRLFGRVLRSYSKFFPAMPISIRIACIRKR